MEGTIRGLVGTRARSLPLSSLLPRSLSLFLSLLFLSLSLFLSPPHHHLSTCSGRRGWPGLRDLRRMRSATSALTALASAMPRLHGSISPGPAAPTPPPASSAARKPRRTAAAARRRRLPLPSSPARGLCRPAESSGGPLPSASSAGPTVGTGRRQLQGRMRSAASSLSCSSHLPQPDHQPQQVQRALTVSHRRERRQSHRRERRQSRPVSNGPSW